MSQQFEDKWKENSRKSVTTYTIGIEDGTLTAYYSPLESKHYLIFSPRQNGSPGKEHAYADMFHNYLSQTKNAKDVLPGYFERVKGLPGIPKHLVEGLEKLIQKVQTI